MSETLTRCPGCNSTDVEAVKVHDPDTTNMNSKCTLRCYNCKHEWEGLTISEHHKNERERGYCI